MHGASRNIADFYRKTGVSSAALGEDPHRLISLMLDGACKRIRLARACMERRDIPGKGKAIADACAIVSHLNASLDHQQGGDIAGRLSDLYSYAMRRLTEANMHNDGAALDEVSGLLEEIAGAWNAIPQSARDQPRQTPVPA
ncbi:flagellar export chaperone FliS [Pseudoxanthomonas sp.]|uniref:flagellar export chaperone FliS n=1 Tax=Pseudoxanthomonas sp. TaxID=1871049 RepID=UPI00262089BB|nr:flagellar export chaperone FliS [Pseudoxanthomonas sp.]WDS36843.1 MAG: flagellar export chaperone FliS [Pseudoxanthomonas sp.]